MYRSFDLQSVRRNELRQCKDSLPLFNITSVFRQAPGSLSQLWQRASATPRRFNHAVLLFVTHMSLSVSDVVVASHTARMQNNLKTEGLKTDIHANIVWGIYPVFTNARRGFCAESFLLCMRRPATLICRVTVTALRTLYMAARGRTLPKTHAKETFCLSDKDVSPSSTET